MSTISRVSYIALEYLQSDLEYAPATESFKLLTNVMDVSIRLFNNIKTSLLKGLLAFKRSELKAYHESHAVGLSRLYNEKRISLYDTELVIPHEMFVSYVDALDILKKNLEKLDIDKTISIIMMYINTLEDLLKKPDFPKMVQHLNEIIPKITRMNRNDIDVMIGSIFSNKQKKETRPFRELFSSFDELKKTDGVLLSYEKFFKNVSSLCNKISNIEASVNNAITLITKSDHYDQNYIKSLYAFVYTTAVQLDAVGVILSILTQLEHNFVIVLNTLVNKNLSM